MLVLIDLGFAFMIVMDYKQQSRMQADYANQDLTILVSITVDPLTCHAQ